ncbi:MAG TPA: amidohydrolase family protein [Gaiellaceae bacterium]|nr:amidohydrolase family protein [Gaiellaceae bacterium]
MIDFHVHQPRANAYGPADLVTAMDGVGVTRAVVFTYEGLLRPSAAANDSLAQFVSAAPTRLHAFATVDPRDPAASAEITRCVTSHGMRGIKLHPWLQGFSSHEPGLDAVCETAAEHGIPILFHDGTPPFSTPLQLASLAERHPRTTIVLGHGGLHDLWREAIAAVAACPNVHLCMCGTPGYAMRAIVRRCPLDRLLFGTDGGLRTEPMPRYAVLRIRQLDEIGLDDDARAAVLDVNPRRLLGDT